MSIRPRVLLVDDHPAFLLGMRSLVATHWPKAAIGEATSVLEARSLLSAPSDLVVLDRSVGSGNGLDLIEPARAAGAQVVVISMGDDPRDLESARHRGAAGWLRKDASPSLLLEALERALSGASLWAEPQASLSPRERAVLEGLIAKVPLKQLASRLGISYSTLNTYRRRLAGKLPHGRAAAAGPSEAKVE